MVTIGPTLEKFEDLCQAVEAGARWFRLPCGYRQRPHLENARTIRRLAVECKMPLKLLLDLPSSRPRTGSMDELKLAIGDRVVFWDLENATAAPVLPGINLVPLPRLRKLLSKIQSNQRIWFCDGRLEFIADEITDDLLFAHLERGSIPLKTSNSIYLPDSDSPFEMLTGEDLALLKSLADQEIAPDWVAFSLVSTPEDVVFGRQELKRYFSVDVRIMAKIETAAAVDRVEEILSAADGIMVARGDLGPAVDFYRLPAIQEQLLLAARRAGKTVVVATQILEGYAESGIPPRPEISGLAELARQAPDAIMLGKETVFSPRPIDCIRLAVKTMTYEADRIGKIRSELPRCLSSTLGPPHVVAIEGPNGAGKTLLCSLLQERLGLPCLRGIPPPWEHAEMKLYLIRDADWFASAMYFLSGVIESSRKAIHDPGEVKLMDRSLWSTLAVHYAHDPGRLDLLLRLLELTAGWVKVPDITIVLEARPETCRQRIARKSELEKQWDGAAPCSVEFHQREREFYHWLAKQWPKVVFLDTEQNDLETVYEKAVASIRENIPCFH